MISLFKNSTHSLKKKYEKLTEEAYRLSKTNFNESLKLQKQAQEIHLQLFQKSHP